MNNYVEHFKTICKHKYYVFKECCKAGIPLRGILHDLSKFSPTEFIESAKYYVGTSSPIVECKKDKGYSKAWFHHRGRNKHHYEYWVDNFDEGMTLTLMPLDDCIEMLCDFIGAGKAYMGKDFTLEKEWRWWLDKREKVLMHPVVWWFIDDTMFIHCMKKCPISYELLSDRYQELLKEFRSGELEPRYRSCDYGYRG